MSLTDIFDTQDLDTQSFERLSGAKLTKIKNAYFSESVNGAVGVNLIVEVDGGEFAHNTIYVTNRNKQNFYHPRKKDGSRDTSKKIALPGMALIDDLSMVTLGKPFSEIMESVEDKQIQVYNKFEKKEEIIEAPVIMDLIGQTFIGGWISSTENKQVKDSSGNYVDDPEGNTYNQFEIRRVFTAEDGYSAREVIKILDDENADVEPKALDAWKSNNEGKVFDNSTTPKDSGARGRGSLPGRGSSSSASRPNRGNLFSRR